MKCLGEKGCGSGKAGWKGSALWANMGSYEGSRLADRNRHEKLSCCRACSAVKGLWYPSSVKEHNLQQPDVTMLIKKRLYVESEF